MANNYTDVGGGYYQDPTTGQVYRRRNPYEMPSDYDPRLKGEAASGYYGVESAREDELERAFGRKRASQNRLSTYDSEAARFRGDVSQRFRTSSEYDAARGVGALQASAGLAGMRAGLGDEYTAAITTDATARFRSQVLSSQLNFESALELAAYEDRMGFVQGELGFMRQLQAMDLNQEYSKEMARFQADLQKDLNAQFSWGDMLEIGGTVLGMALFGPAGAAAGNAVTSGVRGGGSIRPPF